MDFMSTGTILFFIGLGLGLIGFTLIAVDAFKYSSKEGLFCLFIPFYSLYYLFGKYEKGNKKMVMYLLFGGMFIAMIGVIFHTLGNLLYLEEQRKLKELEKFR